MADTRFRFIASKLAEAYGQPENAIEKTIIHDKAHVSKFFEPSGPSSLLYVYETEKGATKPTLHRMSPNESITGKLVYFVRLNPKGISEKTIEADVSNAWNDLGSLMILRISQTHKNSNVQVLSGEVHGAALANFSAIVSELYLPIVQEQQLWGKAPADQAKEFVGTTQKFGSMLSEAVTTVTGGVELRKPESRFVDQYDLKQAAYNQALADESAAREFDACLTSWCQDTERLLAETNKIKTGEEPGPDTELEYWRSRMSNFNSITEQLKNKDCKLVLGVCGTGKTSSYARWKALDLQVTDAANEAKDNVKYLASLELSLEPMYHGSVQDITETLPALMSNVRVRVAWGGGSNCGM